jgi:signal transduction histidine kinase
MKTCKYILFFNLFFLQSLVTTANNFVLVQNQSIDSLLVWASNTNKNQKSRLKYANLALKTIIGNSDVQSATSNYVILANAFFNIGEKEKSLYVADLLYRKSVLTDDVEGTAWATYLKANYYYTKTEYDSSYYYYAKSEKASFTLEYKFLLGLILNSKADILNAKKDYVNAEINSIKALKISFAEKDNLLAYKCYVSLGNSLLGLNDKSKAIIYYRKAAKEVEYLRNDPQYLVLKAQADNYVASTYIEKKEYENAIKYANKALNFEELELINLEMYCYLKNNLAYAKFKLNKSSSEKEFLETLKIADSIKSIPLQLFTKIHLAEYYLKNQNLLKALRYGSEARTQAHKATFFEEELKLLLLLSEIDTKNSTVYTRRYIELNDSLHNVERATRNKYTRIEFETEEITAAKDNAEEQNTFLENRIWMISILSFLTVFIIGLWFINKSQKSKTRQLLLEQKQQQADEEIYQLMLNQQEKIEEGKSIEKQRVSLELHDNVMGKMAAIRMNLYPLIMTSEVENKDLFYKQLDDMQQVEKEIRGVAHDLNTNLFADEVSFIAVVKEFFEKVKNYTTINFELQVGETINWELISTTTKINLYRILQEALQNIEKYADAKNVTVTMSQIDNLVYILIEDDGKGFDTASKKEGIGLQNMKTRMDEMHGKFSIQSAPEKGTKISLIIAV